MKILTLILKGEFFDKILAGEKKNEIRNVYPFSPYLEYFQVGEDGVTRKVDFKDLIEKYFDIEDDSENAWNPPSAEEQPDKLGIFAKVREWDAIQFWHGYQKNRRGMLVKVNMDDTEITDYKDEDGNLMYDTEKNGNFIYPIQTITYSLGEIIKKINC